MEPGLSSRDSLAAADWDLAVAASVEEALPGAVAAQVVLMAHGCGQAAAAALRQAAPEVLLYVLHPLPGPTRLQEVRGWGAAGLLPAPCPAGALADALRAYAGLLRDGAGAGAGDGAGGRPGAEGEGERPHEVRADPPPPAGRGAATVFAQTCLVVTGCKGGVGKSFLATNLAAALKGRLGKAGEVALVDGDLPFGGLAAALGLGQARTWRDWGDAHQQDIDPATARARLAVHAEAGIHVLPCSTEVGDNLLERPTLAAALSALARAFAAVVVDTATPDTNAATLAARQAGLVLFVSTTEPQAVWNLKHALRFGPVRQAFRVALAVPEAAGLVVNRVARDDEYRPEEVAEAVGLPLWGVIPEDPGQNKADAHGQVLVASRPRAEASRAVEDLVDRIFPSLAPLRSQRERGSQGLWRWR